MSTLELDYNKNNTHHELLDMKLDEHLLALRARRLCLSSTTKVAATGILSVQRPLAINLQRSAHTCHVATILGGGLPLGRAG